MIWERAKIRHRDDGKCQGWWKVPGQHRFIPCFCCPTQKSLARIILNTYSVGTVFVRVAGMEVWGRKRPKYEEKPPWSYSSRYMEVWIPGYGRTLAWFSQTWWGLQLCFSLGAFHPALEYSNIKIRNMRECNGDGKGYDKGGYLQKILNWNVNDFSLFCTILKAPSGLSEVFYSISSKTRINIKMNLGNTERYF